MHRFMGALILTLLFMIIFQNAQQVSACSGGIPPGAFPLDYFLQMQTTVAGRIRILSDSRINAVLDIDYYLQGSGDNQYILVSQEPPEWITLSANGRPYPTRCARLSAPLKPEQLFIAGLNHSNNGSYWGYFLFPDADGRFSITLPTQPLSMLSLTYEEAITYIANRVDQAPRPPTTHAQPRAVEVRLVTTSGDTYRLPVDQDTATLVETPSELTCSPWVGSHCVGRVRAPNGVDTAYFYPIGSGVETILNDDLRYTPVFEGQTGVFSVNSDLIAVWSDQMLRIFITASQEGFSTQSPYQSARLPVSYTAPSDDALLTGAGAWSPNGRTFAFSTQSGVWLWDALTPDAQPVRLLTADDEPIRVLHFSPLGNYLALETSARRYHVDIVALETYPDGLFSPDDRVLAVYDTHAAGLKPMRLYTMRPVFEPLVGWQNYTIDVSQVEWTTSINYIVAACGEAILDPEIPSGFEQPWCKVWSRAVGIFTGFGEYIDGTAFDYDPMTRSLAVLAGGYSITLNGETFDFFGQLTSDIAHIEVIPLIDLDYRHW